MTGFFWRRTTLVRMRRHLKNRLTTGILVLIPIYVTWLVLRFIFETMDGILAPLVEEMIGIRIPGLGVIMTLLIVYLVGVVSMRLFGQQLLGAIDVFLSRLPIVKTIYSTFKQISETFALSTRSTFKRVVVIDYPRVGVKAIGFVTGSFPTEENQPLINVFVPTTPNPTSGMLVILPESEVFETNISVEEGIKLVVSGGILTPDDVRIGSRRDPRPGALS